MGIFAGTVTVGLVGSYSPTAGLTSPNELINIAMAIAFTNGTGASQANAFSGFTSTVNAGITSLIDLAVGVELTDIYGNPLTFTKIRGLVVRNKATTAGLSLTLAGDFSSSSLGISSHILGPSGIIALVNPIDGFTVTQTTADGISLQNATASNIDYDFVIWGVK